MSVLVERRCPRDCSLRAAAVVRAPTTATEEPAAALWAVLVQARRSLTEPVGRSRRPEQQAQAAVHRERPVHRAREGPEAAPTVAAVAAVTTAAVAAVSIAARAPTDQAAGDLDLRTRRCRASRTAQGPSRATVRSSLPT